MLIHLYSSANAPPESSANGGVKLGAHRDRPLPALPNGHARGHAGEHQQMRDAQEFELEALMSEDDESSEGAKPGAGRS